MHQPTYKDYPSQTIVLPIRPDNNLTRGTVLHVVQYRGYIPSTQRNACRLRCASSVLYSWDFATPREIDTLPKCTVCFATPVQPSWKDKGSYKP